MVELLCEIRPPDRLDAAMARCCRFPENKSGAADQQASRAAMK
jgi:hypothetical protein